jgi:hypothetical protein
MVFFRTETYRKKDYYSNGHKLDYLIFFKDEYFPISFLSEEYLREDVVYLPDGGFVIQNHIPTNGEAKVYNSIGRFADFLANFKYYDMLCQYFFKVKKVEHSIFFRKGEIYSSTGEILLTLTTNSKRIFLRGKNLDLKVLKLYIAVEFQNNPIYKTIYTKLKEEFIDLVAGEIDIVITKSEKIFSELYRRSFKLTFEDVKSLGNMFDESVQNFYNTFDPEAYKQQVLEQNPNVEIRVIEVERIKEEPSEGKIKLKRGAAYEAFSDGGYVTQEQYTMGIDLGVTTSASASQSLYNTNGFITATEAGSNSIRFQDSEGSIRTVTVESGMLDLSIPQEERPVASDPAEDLEF